MERALGKRKSSRLLWVTWLFTACMVCSCSEQDDAKAIRTLIEKGAQLAEDHDIGGILELTTQTFEANPGALDRAKVKGVLWRIFQYYGAIHIHFPRPHVQLGEALSEATAQTPFLIVKKEQSLPQLKTLRDDPVAWLQEVGENADLYRLTLHLVNHDGDWVVARALVEKFTGLGFGN